MASYTRKPKKLLTEHGCIYLRPGKGDHEFWQTSDGKSFTVDANIKSRHTANKTLKDAGIDKKF